MKNNKKIVIAASFIFAFSVLLFTAILYRNLGLWLIVSDQQPESIDVIFTFAGDIRRVAYSKDLFGKYNEPVWLFSDPKKAIIKTLDNALQNNAKIVIIDTCKSTHSEVAFLTEWIKNQTIKHKTLKIGLVSSPYHMRRIHFAISKMIITRCCTFFYLPVPYTKENTSKRQYKKWWKYEPIRKNVISELEKIVYYWMYY